MSTVNLHRYKGTIGRCIANGQAAHPDARDVNVVCEVQQLATTAISSPIPPGALGLGLAAMGTWGAALRLLYQGRPRGSKAHEKLEVRQSSVEGAGRGVFATHRIPEGTALGLFPGRLRSPREWAAKQKAFPLVDAYSWATANGSLLDPTGAGGELSERPGPGTPWWFDTDPTLACVNEPPPGPGFEAAVNVEVEFAGEIDIMYVTKCDIEAGKELFVDYGDYYDRSAYTDQGSSAAAAADEQR
eukprot:CAMPEP_0118927650 /NCGR_PEP_ID=MMETSP1169-20130426/5080_1 /TAXON_ID=36882 /ORGANISM="Pyramimonas obovata, Strain CCMP722" /LENGTH=243 /DNA_ID=CAMNT_0006869457 /DNA_START=272 /DNA_END=1002 /DNA_ORIENTATION=-